MFCPNCGQKTENPNQRFCMNCGGELSLTPVAPQYTPTTISQRTPVYTTPPGYTSQQKSEEIGLTSILCLIFALISISLVIINLIVLLNLGFYRYGLTMMVAVIVSHFVGLLLGIVSKVNSKLAENSGTTNSVQKVGNTFGILGIIFNAILLAFAIILLPVLLQATGQLP